MIFRGGHHAIRFSHDREALIAAVFRLRSFDHIERHALEKWLRKNAAFLSKDYYWNTITDTFEAVSAVGYPPPRSFDHIKRIELFHFDDTIRWLLTDFGYSCVLCGALALWPPRRRLILHEFDSAVCRRQGMVAPPLVCEACVEAVNGLIGPYAFAQPMFVVEQMIQRAAAHPFRKRT